MNIRRTNKGDVTVHELLTPMGLCKLPKHAPKHRSGPVTCLYLVLLTLVMDNITMAGVRECE